MAALEQAILLGIHAQARPALDAAFVFSHDLGRLPFLTALVLAGWLVARARGDRAVAWVWLFLGPMTLAELYGIKLLVQRPRPALWPPLLEHTGSSFPSGHALATATFFPLIAFLLVRRFPSSSWTPLAWAFGLAMPLYVGFGRLYLGAHWPSDVLAGWTLGGVQSALAARWITRQDYASRPVSLDSSSQAEPSA
jgi:membrane-associated phospholipid phosphatase